MFCKEGGDERLYGPDAELRKTRGMERIASLGGGEGKKREEEEIVCKKGRRSRCKNRISKRIHLVHWETKGKADSWDEAGRRNAPSTKKEKGTNAGKKFRRRGEAKALKRDWEEEKTAQRKKLTEERNREQGNRPGKLQARKPAIAKTLLHQKSGRQCREKWFLESDLERKDENDKPY